MCVCERERERERERGGGGGGGSNFHHYDTRTKECTEELFRPPGFFLANYLVLIKCFFLDFPHTKPAGLHSIFLL